MNCDFRLGCGLCIVVLAACSGGDTDPGAVDTPPEEWRLVEEARIGSVDNAEDALSQVGVLLPLPDGGAWFIEHADRQVRVIGPEGQLTGRVGGPGEGPGEFTFPAGMGWWRGSTDTIWVGDRGTRSVSLFSLEGEFIESHPVPTVEWSDDWAVAQPAVVGPGGVGLGLASYRPGSAAWERFPVVSFDFPEGEVRGEVLSVPRTASVQIQFRGEVLATGAHPMPDSPILSYSPKGDVVVVTHRDTDSSQDPPKVRLVAVNAAGDTLWQRALGYEAEPIPKAETDSIWNERIEGFRRFAQLENRVTADEAEEAYLAAMIRPRHRPPVAWVRIDADNRVLVMWNAAPGSDSEAWLLDSEGALLAAFGVPADQTVIGLDGGTVWLLELDEMGIPFVIRSRFEEA